MPKVTFKFDKEKDLWNHWDKSNAKNSSSEIEFEVNPKVKEICFGRDFDECKKDLVKNFQRIHNSKIIKIYIESINKSWNIIEKEFFRRMNKIMKKEYTQNITAYLTTLGICPYDPNEPSFMFSLFCSIPQSLEICGHEIMHLYFHKFYWKDVEKKIGKEKTSNLKEALTIILDLEFKDLWFVDDKGYESHKELRDFIKNEWKEEKDFSILLNKCMDFLQ